MKSQYLDLAINQYCYTVGKREESLDHQLTVQMIQPWWNRLPDISFSEPKGDHGNCHRMVGFWADLDLGLPQIWKPVERNDWSPSAQLRRPVTVCICWHCFLVDLATRTTVSSTIVMQASGLPWRNQQYNIQYTRTCASPVAPSHNRDY